MAGVARGSIDAGARPSRGARSSFIRVGLLGGFAATADGRPIAIPAAGRRLVAFAALHRRPVTRARAAERLWPRLSPRSAAGSLRAAVSSVHAAHAALLARPHPFVALADSVEVDVHEAEAFAHRLIAGTASEESVPALLERLTLPLLPDCEDDWLRMERDRLQDHFLHALEAYAGRLAASGDYVSALLVIHDALSVDPFRDSAVLVQLAIHIAEGNSALAARIFVDFGRRLDAEVGTKPSAEMREMIAALITRSG